jgi:Flp pilus assembly protein TadD
MNNEQTQVMMQQVLDAYQRADYADSLKLCNSLLIQLGPNEELLNIKASSQMGLGNPEAAEATIRKAVKLNPEQGGLHANAAQINNQLNRPETARKYALEACRLSPEDPIILFHMATVCRDAGDEVHSMKFTDRCLQEQPDNVDALQLKGTMSMESGERDDAETAFQRLVELDPGNALALSMLVNLRQSTLADLQTVRLLENIRSGHESDPMTDPSRIIASFTLADIYKRENQHGQAFRLAQEANDLSAKSKVFDIGYYKSKSEQIRATAEESLSGIEPTETDGSSPVFIIGMPRSGTTLLEQMISAHPEVLGCGELAGMEIIESEFERNGINPYAVDGLHAPSEQQLSRARAAYLAALPPGYEKFRFITDKAPGNYQRAGFIYRLFPAAKFLYCTRHPLDIILSCYFQNFQLGNYYTYSLDDLAQVYVIHVRIMREWFRLMSGRIHVVNYPDLISNPKSRIKKIAHFLDIDFEKAMIEPHKNKRIVKTASAWQVRKPIYKTARNNWKNYLPQLEPVIEYLQQNGVLDDSLQVPVIH